VLRRRRTLALVLLAATVVAVVLLVGAISARLAGGGHPSSAVGAPSPTPAVAASAVGVAAPGGSHVVQPGDTLWSIAAELAPGTDLRPTVDRLVELNGDGPLTVGTRLRLP
jgi:Tfp pilus assembly protein FimV